MKLNDWLKAEKMTAAAFARTSGIGYRQLVHKYRHGERFPTPENLRRIREATKGAVTADDFVDQHVGPSPPFARPTATPKPRARRTPAPPAPGPESAAAPAPAIPEAAE
jgi:transcriptional regulator with XRE-family HTH domain